MKSIGHKIRVSEILFLLAGIVFIISAQVSSAKDTDIYNVVAKQNSYFLMDNSGSMGYGVYESNVDYGAMFDYLMTLHNPPAPVNNKYIWDTINNSTVFYGVNSPYRFTKNKIYIMPGNMGVTMANVNGNSVAFTGDAADPDYLWQIGGGYPVDTHTLIDSLGNLSDDGTGKQRIKIDGNGYITFDGVHLPGSQNILASKKTVLYDGTVVNSGFGGVINAPGYYFSGYKSVSAVNNSAVNANNGDSFVCFFMTGNWINMQAMYNLHYVHSVFPYPQGAAYLDPAWKYEQYPLPQVAWAPVEYQLVYPNPTAIPGFPADPYDTVNGIRYYKPNVIAADSVKKIVPAGAVQIQIHFSLFDITDTDTLKIYDANGTLLATYNNNSPPPGGWSLAINSSAVYLKLSSNGSGQGQGYAVDNLKVTYYTNAYLMQDRMDVAKDAVSYSISALKDKMNWGLATFDYGPNLNPPTGAGAKILTLIDPSATANTQQANITAAMQTISPTIFVNVPSGMKALPNKQSNPVVPATYDITPLGEALQDVFKKGYADNVSKLGNAPCAQNSVIVVSDGYPSGDTDWSRITINGQNVTITSLPTNTWTQNPYQYTIPPASLYGDVAHYIYTHSWLDNSNVTTPTNSFVNVISHQVSFGAVMPLLMDAATQGGGQYISANNKTQLSAALYSLALQMANSVSFTAPIASVDAANKIQNGDDLYFAFFLPQGGSGNTWAGNLKKFEMGDGSAARPNKMMIYDGINSQAINSNGQFVSPLTDMWNNQSGTIDVKSNGAGAILLNKVKNGFNTATYWNRNIYFYDSVSKTIKKFTRNNISPAQLGVAGNYARDKVVNYVYGYTDDADINNGNPLGVRDWVLGSIVHSKPLVIDYYDPNNISILLTRYVVVGSNDGMLHVFDDTPGSGVQGSEVFAFIPEDLLPKLQTLPSNNLVEMVDGGSALYRLNKNPKYLIFGERGGGKSYWCLDISQSNPLNWVYRWQYTNPEIQQTWSDIAIASLPVSVNKNTGVHIFQDVIIFSGGYDKVEDNFPEPFTDLNHAGTPYIPGTTTIDPQLWNVASQDINGNGVYDIYNPGADGAGRGIFVVDIDDPSVVVSDGFGNQILPFQVTYGASLPDTTTGNVQTRNDMKFCFPASPSLVLGSYNYYYRDINNILQTGIQPSTLKAIYGVDIYSNVFKISYDFNEQITKDINDPTNVTKWKWAATNDWSVTKVFSSNPGSTRLTGDINKGGDDPTDKQGRKAFYPPAVSWGGSCSFFDKKNYSYPNVVFSGTDEIATLLFGTGDREHPSYKLTRNRVYSVYDDSSVSAKQYDAQGNFLNNIKVSTASYKENDLLNLTCDELDVNSNASTAQKKALLKYLTDDATYTDNSGKLQLEDNGTVVQENDAKGWYIVLEDQGKCNVGSGTLNSSNLSSTDNHDGEEILSAPVLYAGIVYFTSYQPNQANPCHPQGNGFAYSLDYCTASAAYNLSTLNGNQLELTDRYMKYTNIYGIPSGFAILVRGGQAGAMAMMGTQVVGPQGPGNFPIKGPGLGMELYYWREGNSQK